MKTFLYSIVLSCVLVASLKAGESRRLFIGTYTEGDNAGKGIYTCRFDVEEGEFSGLTLAAPCDNPSFLAIHPTKPRLYAVGSKGKTAKLYAFNYNKANGKLMPLDEKEIPGSGPCHLALCHVEDGDLDAVVVANYSSGTVVSFPIFESGKIGKLASNITHSGSGPNASRQKEPHPHGAYFDAEDGKTVAVPDLGIDNVVYYEIDMRTAKLTPKLDRLFLQLPVGGGPRHLAASKDGRFVYVNNELTSTVCAFDLQGKEPSKRIQELSTLAEGVESDKNSTAEIELAPSGKFLYVSNRGDDSIAVFEVDQESGLLTFLQTVPCGGVRPRFFALDPSGLFLMSCNKVDGTLTLLSVNRKTGKLSPTKESIAVGRPVCIVFAP